MRTCTVQPIRIVGYIDMVLPPPIIVVRMLVRTPTISENRETGLAVRTGVFGMVENDLDGRRWSHERIIRIQLGKFNIDVGFALGPCRFRAISIQRCHAQHFAVGRQEYVSMGITWFSAVITSIDRNGGAQDPLAAFGDTNRRPIHKNCDIRR